MLEFPLDFQKICSVRLPLKYIYSKFSGRSFITYPFPLLILHLIIQLSSQHMGQHALLIMHLIIQFIITIYGLTHFMKRQILESTVPGTDSLYTCSYLLMIIVVLQCFCFWQFHVIAKVGDDPQEDLAKFGYKLNKEVKSQKNPSIFLATYV